ncbi:MAG: hypothetical protein ABSH15_10500 [Verrucomicrobiota bacterium]
MADIPSNIPGAPTGAVPPVKKETGKVQPKKETVRINLPPKPSTAPTIKLPTLPPGGPTGAPSAVPLSTTAAKTSPATAAAAPRTAAAAAAPVAQTRSAPAVQRVAPAAAPTIGALDNILVIAAVVAGLFAAGTVVWMFLILKNAIG